MRSSLHRATTLAPKVTRRDTDLLYGSAADALHGQNPKPAKLKQTTVATFASGHGWGGSGFPTKNLNDTSRPGYSGQVLTGTTAGDANPCFFSKNGGLTAFDPTGKWLCLMVAVNDPARLGYIQLRLSSDAAGTATNYTTISFISAVGSKPMLAGEMYPLWAPMPASGGVTGTGAGTAVVSARVTVTDTGAGSGSPLIFSLGGIGFSSKHPSYPNGLVSFGFDDTNKSALTGAMPILQAVGFRASLFPINEQYADFSGATTTKLYLADALYLQDSLNWEVACHANTQAEHTAGFDALAAADAASGTNTCEIAFQTMRKFGNTNGFRSETLALPGGGNSPAVDKLSRKYFSAVRGTGTVSEMIPPGQPRRLQSSLGGPSTALATLQSRLSAAVASGGWANFTFHTFDEIDGTGGPFHFPLADFQTLVNSVVSSGAAVLPVGEAMLKLSAQA